jgi:hypothetical protein
MRCEILPCGAFSGLLEYMHARGERTSVESFARIGALSIVR